MYRNSEHYPDPTAGAALRRINREEKDLNTGKRFEADFKASVPPGCWYYRFRDSPASYYGGGQDGLRFTGDNICDCQIYRAPFLHLFELKTVSSKSASLTAMFGAFDRSSGRYKKQRHLEDMAQASENNGITASVLIFYRISEHTWAVPAASVLKALQESAEGGRKSITEDYCATYGITVPQRQLRVNWRYDVEALVNALEDRGGR